MENSRLKHGFEYTASSSPVARGPGAWSRERVYIYIYIYTAQVPAHAPRKLNMSSTDSHGDSAPAQVPAHVPQNMILYLCLNKLYCFA